MAKQTFTTGQVLTASQMTSLQQTAMGGGSATAKTASYTLVAADAGATVIMNSASATTITVNTSLFSAGDTVFIQNIGAGISTITAGTATVSTASTLALAQYESGTLYFTAAGVSIFSKADGASAGGGGMTLLSTTSLSGTTTISSISQSYKNLYIVAKAMQSTNNNISFYAQFNGSTANDYTWGTFGASISSVAYVGSSAATNLFPVGHSNGTSGFANQNQFIMEIPRYTETENRFYTVTYYGAEDTNNASRRAVFVDAVYADTTAITSLTILASGNAAYTGTLYIYGVN